jgi:hypothetical protein
MLLLIDQATIGGPAAAQTAPGNSFPGFGIFAKVSA